VPLDIFAGRHSFSIGINPLLMSDTTDIFIIQASQTSYVAPMSSTTNTAVFQIYNGCGLPPLPDYTYTGYQPLPTAHPFSAVQFQSLQPPHLKVVRVQLFRHPLFPSIQPLLQVFTLKLSNAPPWSRPAQRRSLPAALPQFSSW
jgi:hypothetical protein